jgi:hypothetical protein
MAMKDFQSIQVYPGIEDETVRQWMSFGWELKNKQRVKTQDVQRYTGQSADNSTSYYETTRGVDFFELSFERDQSRQNYAELVLLEDQYNTKYTCSKPTISKPIEPIKPNWVDGIGCLWIFLSVITFPFGIVIFVWRYISYSNSISHSDSDASYKKAYKDYEEESKAYEEESKSREKIDREERTEYERKRAEILKKAQSLV